MQGRAGLAWRGGVGTLLLLVTSCIAPERRWARPTPPPVTDARELVRRLAPGVSAEALAALPDRAAPASAAAPVGAPPFLAQAASDADAARARECLTAAVYHEARSESEAGQRAVAQVVLNRVRARAFPNSVCGVVYQGSERATGCQFSFTCDGSLRRPRDPDAWARAERIATAALAGEVMAGVGTATFYHADYVLPWWAGSLTRLGAVGRHVFYRWPNALERALGMRAAYAGVEPGAPSRAPAVSVAGVTITRGGSEESFGVTVHRGGGAPSVAQPSAPLAKPTAQPRVAVSGGVRIHRGADLPAGEIGGV
jgi:spore germination cell wall hydrolase CwlJ-like protein